GVAISDIGGPTANMWQGRCTNTKRCLRVSCCYPKVCRYFLTPQKDHVALLRKVAKLKYVRQVRVASGIRADLALREPEALIAYIRSFTGGQIKVAPEHCVDYVLQLMRKPPLAVFEEFLSYFYRQSHRANKEQYVVPYLLSAFPGCTDEDMRTLAAWLRERHWSPKQTQCFIPTPGTVATAMFYCGKNEAGERIYVARTDAERRRQHLILQGRLPQKR
ncbi:MAG: DUF3362 domain-containing protein, partial [Desulfovibrio sp.]|nr:DUF3362 domain-containing protein [Desulfovibrio sp.]